MMLLISLVKINQAYSSILFLVEQNSMGFAFCDCIDSQLRGSSHLGTEIVSDVFIFPSVTVYLAILFKSRN